MDQESDLQPNEGLPERYWDWLFSPWEQMERARKEALERARKEALERARRAVMEALWIELKEAPEREEFRNLNCMSDEFEKALERVRKEGLERNLMEALERAALHFMERKTKELFSKIREQGGLAFYSEIQGEDIVKMPMRGLHALLQEKSLPDSLRDKINGELAVRRCIEVKGKAAATSSYDTGESSTNTSSLGSPIQAEIHQSSELDHVSIPPAPLKFSMVADHSKCAGANASRRSLNDHTQGPIVRTGRGSLESTVQCYPLPHPPLPASRNEQAHLHEATTKCRDNHKVGGAGTTVYSSEPTAHYQQSTTHAPTDANAREFSNNTSSLNSPFRTESRQSKYASAGASASTSPSGRSLNGHTKGTVVTMGSGPPESTVQHYHPASRNEQAHLQESNAKCRDNHNVGRARTTVLSSELTAHYQPSPAYAPADADIEAGASTTSSEPPPETLAIFNEAPSDILIAGAFTLLSRNSGTFRHPVERALLGVMAVGFISNFTWQLMGRQRRRGRLSSVLQWTAIWAKFVAFSLIMTLLITQ